jgi:hypothetical protein
MPAARPAIGPASPRPKLGEGQQAEDPLGWASDDYASLDAFIERILEERAKVQGGLDGARPRAEIPAPSLPGPELGGLRRPSSESAASRQVGIRLKSFDYELLARAAELYGVAPSTLARMLVRRGARAILDRESPRSD